MLLERVTLLWLQVRDSSLPRAPKLHTQLASRTPQEANLETEPVQLTFVHHTGKLKWQHPTDSFSVLPITWGFCGSQERALQASPAPALPEAFHALTGPSPSVRPQHQQSPRQAQRMRSSLSYAPGCGYNSIGCEQLPRFRGFCLCFPFLKAHMKM